jgi:MscS family membrane protein
MDEAYRSSNEWISAYAASGRLYVNAEEHARIVAIRSRALRAVRALDASRISPVLRDIVSAERAIQLKEILDRIGLPSPEAIPDRDAVSRSPVKRWRLPDTEIDLILIADGPRAGNYLVSADTVDRLPEFYERVKNLPYRPGPAKDLVDTYRVMSGNETATLYEIISNSPIGLDHIIPTRWMAKLPAFAKARFGGVAMWQWLGIFLGFLIGALLIYAVHLLARRFVRRSEEPGSGWHSLFTPAAVMVAAGVLIPLLSTILRISGSPRMALAFAQTIVVFLSAAWICAVGAGVLGEAIVRSGHLTVRSLDGQLVRLAMRFFGLVIAVALLMEAANELGFPAYSVIAGLGVGGLAVALAARDSLANLFGSVLIMFEKPFRVGHRIKVGGVEGLVEDVGFRSTRLRTGDDAVISLPNNSVVNSTVENRSLRVNRRHRILVQLTYDASSEEMTAFVLGIKQIIKDHPLTSKDVKYADDSGVYFDDFGESSQNIVVIFYLVARTATDERSAREEILFKIKKLAREIGVEFAFPTRTLHVGSLPARSRAVDGEPDAAGMDKLAVLER